MSEINTTSTGSSPYFAQGQVSLPDEGQVISTENPAMSASEYVSPSIADTPQSAGTQVAPTAPAVSPAPVSPTTPGASPSQMPQASSATGAVQPAQPTQQNQQTRQRFPIQQTRNTQKENPGQLSQGKTGTAPSNAPPHPSIVRANRLSQIADVLGGGPKYSYRVDPSTGEMKATQVPRSKADVGMAIALEALTGGLAGLSAMGPNATGQAAAAGMAQGQQIAAQRKQQDQQARQVAAQDYSRQLNIFDTNLKTLNNARMMGTQDLASNQAYVGSWKDAADTMRKYHPSSIEGTATYKDFPKYHVTLNNAIPLEVVPRLDSNGEQVKDALGKPLWDINYMIINPNFKVSGLFTDKDFKIADDHNIAGMNNKLVGESPMNYTMAANQKAQLSSLQMMDNEFSKFADSINQLHQNTYEGLIEPTISDDAVNAAVDKASAKYPNVPKALIKGVINQEDPAYKADIVNPKSGATGIMQLMPNTAKELGVNDLTNIDQNVDGGVKYLSMLMQRFSDPKLVLAAYNAGPSNPSVLAGKIPDNGETQDYVDNISKNINLDGAKIVKSGEPLKLQSIKDITGKDSAFNTAEQEFQVKLGMASGSYLKAISLLSQPVEKGGDPAAAAKIVNYLGGLDNLRNYDTAQSLDLLQHKANIEENKTLSTAAGKNALDTEQASKMQQYVKVPPGFTTPPNMYQLGMNDLENTLRAKGVKIPTDFPAIWSAAHYMYGTGHIPGRVWAKGTPDEMDNQTFVSYIDRFINPMYDDTQYASKANFRRKIEDPTVKNGGALIQSANVVSAHLNQLDELSKALDDANHHNNLQPLNQLANRFNIQIGKTPANTYTAVATAVASEMAKLVSGDKPTDDVVQKYISSLNPKNSYAQTQDLINNLLGLAYGRVNAMNDESNSELGENLHNVSKTATKLFQERGFDTPWATGYYTQNMNQGPETGPTQQFNKAVNAPGQPQQAQPQQAQPQQPQQTQQMQPQTQSQQATQTSKQFFSPSPGVATDYRKLSADGRIGIGPDGKQYAVATGKLIPGQ